VIDLFAIVGVFYAAKRHLANQVICFIHRRMLPDTVKFVAIIGLVAGAVYGTVLALATFPPEPAPVIKSLPHEKLRQK
jgi:hypothetical protein